MNKNKILVTASDNIPFSEIEKHFGVVDSQIVVGANIFRDAFAGFRDIFGGQTKGYKKDIDKMKNAAIASIKKQANEKGANAIISVRIDLDEYSGGGKSMFMLNIYGSAIKLKEAALESEANIEEIKEFSIEDINYYKERNNLKHKIEETDNIFQNIDTNSITKYNLWTKDTTCKVLEASEEAAEFDPKRKDLNANFSKIPANYLEEFLINNLHEIQTQLWNSIYDSLESRNWFNYNLLKQLLHNENHIIRFRALRLCAIEKEFYERNESKNLKELGNFILKDFNKSISVVEVKKMVSNKEVSTCPNCLKQKKANVEYCDCGANKYGSKDYNITPKNIGQNLIETAAAIEIANKSLN